MAIGDKVILADKETLDAVNSKVGAANDTGGNQSSGTLMGKLNALLSGIATHVANWTAARAANLDAAVSSRQSEANALARYDSISTNTGPNNTASATGTLSQKLSHIISLLAGNTVKYKKSRQTYLDVDNVGTYTFVNVTGAGSFHALFGHVQYFTNVVIEIDGEVRTYSPSISSTAMAMYMNIFGDMTWATVNEAYAQATPMHFTKSFVLRATLSSGSATPFRCLYDLYE